MQKDLVIFLLILQVSETCLYQEKDQSTKFAFLLLHICHATPEGIPFHDPIIIINSQLLHSHKHMALQIVTNLIHPKVLSF